MRTTTFILPGRGRPWAVTTTTFVLAGRMAAETSINQTEFIPLIGRVV